MLTYNKEKRVAFLHVLKNGGSSIREGLLSNKKYGYKQMYMSSIGANSNIEPDMIGMLFLNSLGDKEWNKFFTFSFVRNPWDRFVSLYHFIKSSRVLQNYKTKIEEIDRECFTSSDRIGLSRLANILLVEKRLYNRHWLPQWKFLCNNNKEIIFDFVGRFENFVSDINFVINRIDLGCINIPHIHKTKHKHYSVYYDKATIGVVAEYYKEDIDLFNYSFEVL